MIIDVFDQIRLLQNHLLYLNHVTCTVLYANKYQYIICLSEMLSQVQI